jgi:hypothetical protein
LAIDSSSGRRKYPRVKTDVLFAVARVDSGDGVAYAVDLSLGGIRFQAVGLRFEIGEILRITLNLDGTEVSAVGKLVRITQLDAFTQELALAFAEVDARTLKLLEDHLENAEEA